jgi:hypothetical protein
MPNARMSTAGGFSPCDARYLDFYVQIKHSFSKPKASRLFYPELFTAFLILALALSSCSNQSFLPFVGSLAGFGPAGNICFMFNRTKCELVVYDDSFPRTRKAAAMPEPGPFLPAVFGTLTPVCARACCYILSRSPAALDLCQAKIFRVLVSANFLGHLSLKVRIPGVTS